MLLAIDIAVMLPAEIEQWAIQISGALPSEQSQGLRLDLDHLPHITLAQAFVAQHDIDRITEALAATASRTRPLDLTVVGGARSHSSVSLEIEPTAALQALHVAVMAALAAFEQPAGDATAFADEDARPRDIAWVTNFRTDSSFARYWPHITLGHAERAPDVPRRSFSAVTIAACHLGRFCSCRRPLSRLTLS